MRKVVFERLIGRAPHGASRNPVQNKAELVPVGSKDIWEDAGAEKGLQG